MPDRCGRAARLSWAPPSARDAALGTGAGSRAARVWAWQAAMPLPAANTPPASARGVLPAARGAGAHVHPDEDMGTWSSRSRGVFRREICLKQFPRTRGSPSACPEGESVSACSWTSSEGQKRQKNSRLSMFNPVPGRGHGPSKAGASTLP